MKFPKLPKLAISLPLAILAAAILIFINEASFRQSTQAVSRIEEAQKTRGAPYDCAESPIRRIDPAAPRELCEA